MGKNFYADRATGKKAPFAMESSKDTTIDRGSSKRDICVMTSALNQRATAYDPFGEPMAVSRGCAENKGAGSYRETRHAAVVFWALAMLFVGGRIYLSDQPVMRTVTAMLSPSVQVTSVP